MISIFAWRWWTMPLCVLLSFLFFNWLMIPRNTRLLFRQNFRGRFGKRLLFFLCHSPVLLQLRAFFFISLSLRYGDSIARRFSPLPLDPLSRNHPIFLWALLVQGQAAPLLFFYFTPLFFFHFQNSYARASTRGILALIYFFRQSAERLPALYTKLFPRHLPPPFRELGERSRSPFILLLRANQVPRPWALPPPYPTLDA